LKFQNYNRNCLIHWLACEVIPRLRDRANIEQTSSKCIQNIPYTCYCSTSARRLLDVRSMFARSCKRGIRPYI